MKKFCSCKKKNICFCGSFMLHLETLSSNALMSIYFTSRYHNIQCQLLQTLMNNFSVPQTKKRKFSFLVLSEFHSLWNFYFPKHLFSPFGRLWREERCPRKLRWKVHVSKSSVILFRLKRKPKFRDSWRTLHQAGEISSHTHCTFVELEESRAIPFVPETIKSRSSGPTPGHRRRGFSVGHDNLI